MFAFVSVSLLASLSLLRSKSASARSVRGAASSSSVCSCGFCMAKSVEQDHGTVRRSGDALAPMRWAAMTADETLVAMGDADFYCETRYNMTWWEAFFNCSKAGPWSEVFSSASSTVRRCGGRTTGPASSAMLKLCWRDNPKRKGYNDVRSHSQG